MAVRGSNREAPVAATETWRPLGRHGPNFFAPGVLEHTP